MDAVSLSSPFPLLSLTLCDSPGEEPQYAPPSGPPPATHTATGYPSEKSSYSPSPAVSSAPSYKEGQYSSSSSVGRQHVEAFQGQPQQQKSSGGFLGKIQKKLEQKMAQPGGMGGGGYGQQSYGGGYQQQGYGGYPQQGYGGYPQQRMGGGMPMMGGGMMGGGYPQRRQGGMGAGGAAALGVGG